MQTHVLASLEGRAWFLEVMEPLGYTVTFSPKNEPGVGPSAELCFAEELRNLERARLVVVDADLEPGEWMFSVGYAVARGKSVVAVATRSLGFRLHESMAVFKSGQDLRMALATFIQNTSDR